MAQEIQRSRGRPSNYRQDRGGMSAEYGPFFGKVKNNVDPTRQGRLQVYIETFADGDPEDDSKWVTVSYMPPFYGATPPNLSANTGAGTFAQNQCSYGMWFTPPDIGLTVVCVFVNGDRNLGYYIGVVPENGITHMIPAIGAEANYISSNPNQDTYFADAPLMPVTEINSSNERFDNASRFYDQEKPIHSVVASAMFQQGISKDTERGPIQSSSQRESPSAVFGISTPGVAIYQGGLKPSDIRERLNSGAVKPQDVSVIGRMGGHTLVMDDGDIDGRNQLFRLRTAKGHQIMMNDSNNFIHIIHANGQTWIELGVEGTVDVFSTNSVNVHTNGDINMHADRDINMFAGRDIKVKAKRHIITEADVDYRLTAKNDMRFWSKNTIGVKADGTLAIQSADGSWNGGSALKFTAGGIDLNGPAAPAVPTPQPIQKKLMDNTKFDTSKGWIVDKNKLESIVDRAPTHEPWPYHNLGVDTQTSLETGQPTPPPGAPAVPAGVNIRRD
jgi:hypothetical protein